MDLKLGNIIRKDADGNDHLLMPVKEKNTNDVGWYDITGKQFIPKDNLICQLSFLKAD